MPILLKTQVDRTAKTPVTARRARVSGLCGFPGAAERVPAKYQKTGRCAAVQERCKNEKGDKMSTEFYCEEFPTEQNGKPVQTLKDLLEACPEDRFHFMTPFGYVDLNAQDAERLRQGAAMPAHAGESGWGDTYSGRKAAAAGACHCAENREWSMVRDYHRSAAENVGIGADAGDAAVTGSAFRAVAPVSAVCAAFRTQPSAYPPEAAKPDVAPTCRSVAEMASAEGNRLRAAFGGGTSRKRRGRRKA